MLQVYIRCDDLECQLLGSIFLPVDHCLECRQQVEGVVERGERVLPGETLHLVVEQGGVYHALGYHLHARSEQRPLLIVGERGVKALPQRDVEGDVGLLADENLRGVDGRLHVHLCNNIVLKYFIFSYSSVAFAPLSGFPCLLQLFVLMVLPYALMEKRDMSDFT